MGSGSGPLSAALERLMAMTARIESRSAERRYSLHTPRGDIGYVWAQGGDSDGYKTVLQLKQRQTPKRTPWTCLTQKTSDEVPPEVRCPSLRKLQQERASSFIL